MAHVRRHPKTNRWQGRYRGADGKEHTKLHNRKGDALHWAEDEERKVRLGTWTAPELGRHTFSNYAELVMAGRVHLRANSSLTEQSLLRKHVLPALGDRALANITPGHVRALVSTMMAAGYAPATVEKAYLVVKIVCDQAVVDGYLARTPCVGIHLPRDESKPMRIVTPDQLWDIAGSIDRRYRAAVVVAGTLGLRQGEVFGLKVEDLLLLDRPARVRVERQVIAPNGRAQLAPLKTAASRRTVTAPPVLVDEIAEHLALYPAGEDRMVVTSPKGGLVVRQSWRQRFWTPATERAGLEGLDFHDLRHSHAAHLIAQGEHPKVISERLGHSSIRVTMDVYGHLMEGLDVQVADRLEAFLGRPADPARTHRGPGAVVELPRAAEKPS